VTSPNVAVVAHLYVGGLTTGDLLTIVHVVICICDVYYP
jgi:hypothetical protein